MLSTPSPASMAAEATMHPPSKLPGASAASLTSSLPRLINHLHLFILPLSQLSKLHSSFHSYHHPLRSGHLSSLSGWSEPGVHLVLLPPTLPSTSEATAISSHGTLPSKMPRHLQCQPRPTLAPLQAACTILRLPSALPITILSHPPNLLATLLLLEN